LNNKWNVYKTFKNGRRAKAPTMEFEAETQDFFFEQILPTLNSKLQKIKWEILDSSESQNRQEDAVDKELTLQRKKQAAILAQLMVKKMPHMQKKNIIGCLMLNKHTNWRWAWCAAESITNIFLAQLSPDFKCRKDADEWIKQKMEMTSL
jgi:hypothetical protein|tara:strand:- start:449 stop:898 length:450 start_codon:yes stop_codon:yes gene_type:complete